VADAGRFDVLFFMDYPLSKIPYLDSVIPIGDGDRPQSGKTDGGRIYGTGIGVGMI
jgi:hypothetical protein